MSSDASLRILVKALAALMGLMITPCFQAAVQMDLSAYDPGSEIRVERGGDQVSVRWAGSGGRFCELVLSLNTDQPLVQSVATMDGPWDRPEVILRDIDPVTLLTVGERDLAKRSGWVVFFDKVHTRPSSAYRAVLELQSARVVSGSGWMRIELSSLKAGGFHGRLDLTVISGSSLLRVDSVLATQEDGRAILYDSGITSGDSRWTGAVWMDSKDQLRRTDPSSGNEIEHLSVRYRTIVAEGERGSLAVFPPPHQFFYPLDFADNFGFVWRGQGYRDRVEERSIGVRQPLDGDRRYVPWFNAPPATEQRLGVYWLLTSAKGEEAIGEVARYTRGDHYPALPGYQRFTSHYHVEHTLDYLKWEGANPGVARRPDRLESPGFVEAFRKTGADIVHLAEFHNGRTPRMKTRERLAQLQRMHSECKRLSEDDFLLLPGEEPNVHLGGHWLSFFPRPVNWVLNRPNGTPFVQEIPDYGKVYHVGSRADVLELMERENGLMWTAHARIKSSTGYPDQYREETFFRSDRFLGAAWKAMPADLSWRRLGKRILGLMDDMANWGPEKYVLGEVDVFKIEPDYELYGHMNMNYLRLERLPRYEEGWGSVLGALREGAFFVTTGEVLLPEFSVGGVESGQRLNLEAGRRSLLEFEVDWTFPLAFAEIITGDGSRVYRDEIDLRNRREFGRETIRRELDLKGKKWIRLEVWDVASNGAFTQPVWIDADYRP